MAKESDDNQFIVPGAYIESDAVLDAGADARLRRIEEGLAAEAQPDRPRSRPSREHRVYGQRLVEFVGSLEELSRERLRQIEGYRDKFVELARISTRRQTLEQRPDYSAEGLFMRQLRTSSFWTDVKMPTGYRELMRTLTLTDLEMEAGGPQALKFIGDTFVTMRADLLKVADLPTLRNDKDYQYMTRRALVAVDDMIVKVGRIGYDSDWAHDWEHDWTWRAGVWFNMGVSLALNSLPFFYAYYSRPREFFYLDNLAGATARTVAVGAGVLFNPAANYALVRDHLLQRTLLWAVPSVLYSAEAFDGPTGRESAEAKATKAESTPLFLAGAGVAEWVTFEAANSWQQAPAAFHKVSDKIGSNLSSNLGLKSTRFAVGKMTLDREKVASHMTDEEARQFHAVMEDIDSSYHLGSELLKAFLDETTQEWQGTLTAAQRRRDREIRHKELYNIPLTPQDEQFRKNLASRKTPEHQHIDPLATSQRAIHSQALAGLTELDRVRGLMWTPARARTEAETEAHAPRTDSQIERRVGSTALVTSATLLSIGSSISVIATDALLTDFIPYYGTSLIKLIGRARDSGATLADVADVFGNYFGGTALGMPLSIPNGIVLLATKIQEKRQHQANATGDGLFDLEHPGNPDYPVEHNPNLHPFGGQPNFWLATGYSILSTMYCGGQVGGMIAAAVTDLPQLSLRASNFWKETTNWVMQGLTARQAPPARDWVGEHRRDELAQEIDLRAQLGTLFTNFKGIYDVVEPELRRLPENMFLQAVKELRAYCWRTFTGQPQTPAVRDQAVIELRNLARNQQQAQQPPDSLRRRASPADNQEQESRGYAIDRSGEAFNIATKHLLKDTATIGRPAEAEREHETQRKIAEDMDAYVQRMNENAVTAAARLRALGAIVASNGGTANNCLILSLLQHATGNYANPGDADMVDMAESLRRGAGLPRGRMLYPEEGATIIDEINRIYGIRMRVTVLQPDTEGHLTPALQAGRVLGDPNPGATEVVLLQGGNHYQAVTMLPERLRPRLPPPALAETEERGRRRNRGDQPARDIATDERARTRDGRSATPVRQKTDADKRAQGRSRSS